MTSSINSNAFLSSLMSSNSATSGSSASAASSGTLADASNFYNLLVTQLTNQDPLNPMDPSGMSAELAQFSTASGIQSVEQSLTALTSQITQSEGLQAANLVGHNVIYNSNSLSLGSSGTAAGGFTLSGAAANVDVQVTNSAGQVVDTLQLGSMQAGVQAFSWNGTDGNGNAVAQGNYNFTVQATDSSGNSVAATPFGVGTVSSVLLGSGGPSLELQGQSGSVPLSSLQGVI